MRTHTCGELRTEHIGQKVRLAGWVHRRRDHGGVIFIDLRDREGLTQTVFHPQEHPAAYASAEKLRSEFVISATGMVTARREGATNPNIATGEIEVVIDELEVLAEAQTTPFPIEDRLEITEEIRLRYRYLDLRRPEMQRLLRLRHRAISAIRRFFDDEGFVEVETPMLNKSTPEGARDYLVPSRLQPGTFYALQQSPQLFKQLLMVAGLDRYYQIVRCFRDEDPRADRQPDFTQLDMEMSFVDENKVMNTAERMFALACKAAVGVEINLPFPRMTFDDAMASYGTDKPDLRFGLEMIDVTDVLRGTQAQVFRKTLDVGGVAKALTVSGGVEKLSRKDLDELTRVARELGAGGLAWVGFLEDGVQSPLAKFLGTQEVDGLRTAGGVQDGDMLLIICDTRSIVDRSLGEVRLRLADLLALRPVLPPEDPEAWKFVWIVDPPLVQFNEKEDRWDPAHHPFTAPRPKDEALLESDPGAVKAQAYDAVLNGWEVAGGSIRIHRPDLQRRVFSLIGIDDETAEHRFGWFVRAFDFGAPPHGGIAAGLDRFVALMAGKDSIREVMAFPKTKTMTDLMTGAPDAVDDAQLQELHIRSVAPRPD